MKPGIQILLPKNRLELGVIRLLDGVTILHEGPALGLADGQTAAKSGNPNRSPFRRNGDTPTGEYLGFWLATGLAGPDGPAMRRKYGLYPILNLTPTAGHALVAAQKLTAEGLYGRSGIAIHSGDLNFSPAYAKWKQMRPTNGCIRVLSETHQFLFEATRNIGGLKVTVSEL